MNTSIMGWLAVIITVTILFSIYSFNNRKDEDDYNL